MNPFLIACSVFVLAPATMLTAADSPNPPPTAPGKLIFPNAEAFTVADRPAFVFLPAESKRAKPQPWIFYAPTLPAYPDEAER